MAVRAATAPHGYSPFAEHAWFVSRAALIPARDRSLVARQFGASLDTLLFLSTQREAAGEAGADSRKLRQIRRIWRLTDEALVPRVADAPSTERPRLMALRVATASAEVSRKAGRSRHRLGAFSWSWRPRSVLRSSQVGGSPAVRMTADLATHSAQPLEGRLERMRSNTKTRRFQRVS
jgi:hypothetical protein